MSWSVSAFGKAPAVAAKIAADLSHAKCIEPEEGVKQAVALVLVAALAAQGPNAVVRVEASGHQGGVAGEFSPNTLNIKVDPVYGFVE